MLIANEGACFVGYLLISLVIYLCAGYVYRVNARRKADDPEKRDYHPAAVPLSLGWPLLVPLMVIFFVLRALAYGAFLILFTVGLVVIRKPFLLVWLMKAATKIGTMLLDANTFLIRRFFPESKPAPA